ncbi:hypothetical protein, partial [Kineosporia sp. NBRC 101677]|uniref:hypothetical protein n=1 Tax=Kineosporia sp. NBRC 101677 TaxID=3032197 RepID=UPI002556014F
ERTLPFSGLSAFARGDEKNISPSSFSRSNPRFAFLTSGKTFISGNSQSSPLRPAKGREMRS